MKSGLTQTLQKITASLAEKKWDVALNYVNCLLEIQENPGWLVQRGLILIKLARWQEAARDFRAVLEKDSEHIVAREALRYAENQMPTRDSSIFSFYDRIAEQIQRNSTSHPPLSKHSLADSQALPILIAPTPTPQSFKKITPPTGSSSLQPECESGVPSMPSHAVAGSPPPAEQPSAAGSQVLPEMPTVLVTPVNSDSKTLDYLNQSTTNIPRGIPSNLVLPILPASSNTISNNNIAPGIARLPVSSESAAARKVAETTCLLPSRYEIHAQLESQDSVARYQAFDNQTNRFVLIKMAALNSNASKFLKAEGQLLAQLQHPHIARAYDIGKFQNNDYLVMEWTNGKTLAKWMEGRSLTLQQAISVMHQLTTIVGYLHRNKILHRHLCPSQIMMDKEDTPYLENLGQGCSQQYDAWIGQTWIMDQQIIYSAPEIARGFLQEADFSTDVYSLGVIFYELLTNHLPFHAPNNSALLLEILHNPPLSPTRFCPLLPSELESICLKAISKRKQERYAHANEFATALQPFAKPSPVSLPPPPKSKLKKFFFVMFILLLFSLLAGEIYFYDKIYKMQIFAESQQKDCQAIQQEALQERQQAEEKLKESYTLNMKWQQDKEEILILQAKTAKECHEARVRIVQDTIQKGYQEGLKRYPVAACQYYIQALQDASQLLDLSPWHDLVRWQLAYNFPYLGKRTQINNQFGKITCIAASGDGQNVAISGSNNLIWQPQNNQTILLKDSEFRTLQFRFHPQKPVVASVLEGGKILFSHYDENIAPKLLDANSEILDASFRNDGNIFATVHAHSIRLWDINNWKLQSELKATSEENERSCDEVPRITFSPDGQLLLLAHDCKEGTIQFWNFGQQKRMKVLTGYYSGIAGISCIATDAGFFKMAVISNDGFIQLWKCKNDGSSVERMALMMTSVADANIAWGNHGEQLYTRDSQGNFCIWDGDNGSLLMCLPIQMRQFLLLPSCPERLLILDHTDQIQIWELPLLRYHQSSVQDEKLRPFIIHPNNQMILSLSTNYNLVLWNIQNGIQINKTLGNFPGVVDGTFTRDGKYLLLVSNQDKYCVTAYEWENLLANSFLVLENQEPISHILFSPDGKMLAIASEKNIRLLSWPENAVIQTITTPDLITTLAFSLDQQVLALGVRHQIQLWNLRNYQLRSTLEQHSSNILSLAFSPDRDLLASTGYDQTIILWNWKLGKATHVLNGHTGPVYDLGFIQRSENTLMPILVSMGSDQQIRFWHLGTCQSCEILSGFGKNHRYLAIPSNGSMVIFGGDDNTLHSWNMTTHRECFSLPIEELQNRIKDW